MQPFTFQDFTSCYWGGRREREREREREALGFVLLHRVFLAKNLSIYPWLALKSWILGSFSKARAYN
jgi:hypothetical protein